jgi:isopentenyl-diphosphate delta-isomerase
MGPASLHALMQLPLKAIDFGAAGGTNFSILEILRSNDQNSTQAPFAYVGHTANEMVGYVNDILENDKNIACNSFIISGGVKTFLDGYYHISKIKTSAVYGQAAPFLKVALSGYDAICSLIEEQKKGYLLAKNILKVRP